MVTAAMDGGGRPSGLQAALLAASAALTALLCSAYRHKARQARGLQGARRLRLDGELRAVLLEAPGRCVPYAVIEGVVRSVRDTLSSQFVEDCRGVVQRLTLQEHKMVNDYEKVIHQRTNTAPFELAPREAGAGVAVRVTKPLEAAELSLETVHEKFHPSVHSFAHLLGHYISGERPKGVRETEQMLKVGTLLTGVGELVLDSNAIKLQPPKQGLRYYLSSADFDALLQKQRASARLWKILAFLSGFATCSLLFLLLRGQYRQRRERRRLQEEFRQAQELRLRRQSAAGVPKNACAVCLSNAKACVFLECGHVCSCDECYRALPHPKACPICRQPIARVVPLYNS
ncbi:Mitochondrial ubiquitin ligase activator of NFKB 1 [Aix galericulata]|nr:Mitochondrial ubiquitin ligase activator of NFKB 1 [Aix galericulata]